MKKKLFFVLSLVIVMICVLAITSSAATYTVNYNDGKATQETDENGVVTLREEKFSSTNASKTFFGWYSLDGDMFKPGETVTLTENVNLYEAYGYLGTNVEIPFGVDGQWGWPFIQLQENIVLDAAMSTPWGGCATVDLNGYTITTSAKNAVDQQRSGVRFVGEGSIIHTGTGSFFNASTHGYGDGSQYLLIGKNVTVKTNGTLFNYTNNVNSNIPVAIYGDVTCGKLISISGFNEGKLVNVTLEPTNLQVTGDSFITCSKYPETASINITINGGTFELSAAANDLAYWDNGNAVAYTFAVTGGSFTNGSSIALTFANGYATTQTEVNGTTYTTIIPASECAHNYELKSTVNSTCIDIYTNSYVCSECGSSYQISYGELNEHVLEQISDKPATTTEAGLKIYECTVCGLQYEVVYAFDPSDLLINVTVNTEEGEKTVQAKVSDVLDLTFTDNMGSKIYTLVGIKDFDTYLASDVLSIEIPIGISFVNLANNSTLKSIVILDNANVTVTSIAKATAVTEINIGAATVTFLTGCSNNAIESIRSEVSGANVSFEKQAFDSKSSFKNLKLSANSTYVFGANSFRQTGITEFVAPDYSDVTFLNEAAFYKCNSLKYIYIGRGIETLAGKPFDYCQYVEKVVLMDVTSISMEWTFCVQNMAEKPVEYYIHSSTLNLPSNTFGQSKGIIIYTNAPITNTNAFSSCSGKTYNGIDYPAYTIIYGIPHAYESVNKEPTCSEEGAIGYSTSCPCGEQLDGSVIAKKFVQTGTNSESFEELVFEATVVPKTPHEKAEALAGISYKDGYDKYGYGSYLCVACNATVEDNEATIKPLFTFKGYSMPEDGELAISIGFEVNKDALAVYEALSGKELNYGLVAAIAEKLNGKAPLDNDVEAPVIKASVDKEYSSFDFVLNGFTEEQLDLSVVLSAYVIDGDNVVYIQDGQLDAPTSISINQYISSITPSEPAPEE